MTDLLPIIFVRGQNESIDPRVAPPDVHAVARNVRWRKDGRPAKRYGMTAVSTDGLATDGYGDRPVNAIASWNGNPVLAIGASVRQLGPLGWDLPVSPGAGSPRGSEISHFGPGQREVVARDETRTIGNVSSGFAPTLFARRLIVHAWDAGGSLFFSVKDRSGAMIVTPRVIPGGGTSPRVIATSNFIYILCKAGATLQLYVFDPNALTFTIAASPGTLDAAGSNFDAFGRSTDFLIVYQSAALVATVSLVTDGFAPAVSASQTFPLLATGAGLGVTGSRTSIVVAAAVSGAGTVRFAAFDNLLAGVLGGAVIEVDPNNGGQPGLVMESNTVAQVMWSGFIAATETSYIRAAQVQAAGVIATGGTAHGVSLASKPFMGPSYPTFLPDSHYVWVATHNANNNSTKWDTQRAYLLVRARAFAGAAMPIVRHMHVPNVAPSPIAQNHLSDVLDLANDFGYLTPLLNAVRFGNGLSPAMGFDAVTFHNVYLNQRSAARDTTIAGRVLQISGGSLYELNGSAEETGFSNTPVIQSITGGGGGALTSPGTYIYRAVYEWIDDQGRRHRSAPSDPFTFSTGANTSASLVMKPLVASSHSDKGLGFAPLRGVTLHVYRSLAGQSTLHRVTPNVGAPDGYIPGNATVPFVDLMSDALAGEQEFLYTEGGVADNTLCPPHRFQTVCNARLWVGGQLDACVITATKLLVDGEPSQFSDLEEFNVFLPEPNTGIASIDGTVVAFAREKIYVISGDGPNDQGIGSFSPPSELPTDVGCIDWRSVVETSAGVFFQGKRGIYLLPRGFNTPLFVGAEVESTLAAYPVITSATVVTMESAGDALGEVTVRFVAAQSVFPFASSVLVYDLRTGGWSVDELGEGPDLGGTWLGAFIEARGVGAGGTTIALYSEAPGTAYGDHFSRFFSTTLATGDIRPFGLAGYGGFESVVLVGEFRGASVVTVRVSVDGALSDSFAFQVTAPDGAADNSVYLDVTPRVRLGSAIRVECSDAGDPSAPTEGFIMQGLFIEHETIGKTKRLAAARRA